MTVRSGLLRGGLEPLEMLEVFAAPLSWWCDDLAAGLGAEILVAGVCEYLQVDGV